MERNVHVNKPIKNAVLNFIEDRSNNSSTTRLSHFLNISSVNNDDNKLEEVRAIKRDFILGRIRTETRDDKHNSLMKLKGGNTETIEASLEMLKQYNFKKAADSNTNHSIFEIEQKWECKKQELLNILSSRKNTKKTKQHKNWSDSFTIFNNKPNGGSPWFADHSSRLKRKNKGKGLILRTLFALKSKLENPQSNKVTKVSNSSVNNSKINSHNNSMTFNGRISNMMPAQTLRLNNF